VLEGAYKKLRHLFESLIAVLLFSFQQIPVVFTWTWPMLWPLGAYFTSMLWMNSEVSPIQIHILFFEPRLMPGRIIAAIGFILFLIALFQFIKQRGQLASSGFYSIVRHPQYFSLIIMAYGISVMASEYGGSSAAGSILLNLPGVPWLVLVYGYALLAFFEESRLTKEHEQYRQYKKQVPFLFPVHSKSRIEEAILSITIILVMWFILAHIYP
jgi:hypothetical protein